MNTDSRVDCEKAVRNSYRGLRDVGRDSLPKTRAANLGGMQRYPICALTLSWGRGLYALRERTVP